MWVDVSDWNCCVRKELSTFKCWHIRRWHKIAITFREIFWIAFTHWDLSAHGPKCILIIKLNLSLNMGCELLISNKKIVGLVTGTNVNLRIKAIILYEGISFVWKLYINKIQSAKTCKGEKLVQCTTSVIVSQG